jgi:hypothetical protein
MLQKMVSHKNPYFVRISLGFKKDLRRNFSLHLIDPNCQFSALIAFRLAFASGPPPRPQQRGVSRAWTPLRPPKSCQLQVTQMGPISLETTTKLARKSAKAALGSSLRVCFTLKQLFCYSASVVGLSGLNLLVQRDKPPQLVAGRHQVCTL